ncbi:Fip1 motif [Carpediemonas membranifera]|uniref:Fip1 motif n=1 Tax=Carpediemonas membranifera TaxID=201153 RepID=A0A8J6E433_9EUKA|nr:Fip1 motif [Carpediemonas membranifera]|eukprot:KAG9396713.1 Fip1 motif [Carpediemonas membranifera]
MQQDEGRLDQWLRENGASEPTYKGKSIYELDLDNDLTMQLWRNPDADLSDYFNYGFNEQSWKLYAAHMARMQREAAEQDQ